MFGANGFAAVEAIRGEMGWSIFSESFMKGCMGFNHSGVGVQVA